ncbi:conjugal transfer mating pair stabilization protein TraN [Legionella birminghamensis]|uniref:Conjugal transfer mating pair stabilization protein TraN n=1 Tax=Legionella birminghamensis TaxID=28083 RepID=A0A378JZL6_9GAMM|nr:type-F conjugative transfer system mating-pair stabilization protein TraN [Legionella birminghamensis]KTC69797.1 conjugal transfer mating pair stabilization protein TraN [Legionella birminghamensis]STX60931.1 putative conjugative transfer protein TraN [Legionella birminghamensis]
MSKWFFLTLWCSFTCLANQTGSDFDTLKNYAKSLSAQPKESMNAFNPHSLFDNYSEHPEQEGYYQGIQTEKTDLSSSAQAAIQNDQAARIVIDNFGRNQFELNLSSSVLAQSQLIQDESYAIVHGISNDRVQCDSQAPVCEMKTHEEQCFSSRLLPDQTCSKTLKVIVESEKVMQRADFSFVVAKKWTGVITVNLFTGVVTNAASSMVPYPIRMQHPCDQLQASVHAIQNNGDNAYWVQVIGYPSCANNGVITFFINKEWGRSYPIQVALTVNANSKPYISQEIWISNCTPFEKQGGLCRLKKERCTDSQSSKTIEGLPVSRDCWAREFVYSCSSATADECTLQKNKGCLQIASECSRYENNYCALYKQTYSCQENVCQSPVECVKDLFCADGECIEHIETQNADFGQSVSALAVAGEAGRELSQQPNMSLFSGKAVQCKIWPVDIIDCCHDKGWGKAIDLTHCREEDKALGKAKLNYVAHYLGEFCSQEVAGVCLEKKRSYCVFPSKMARIIQEARLTQVNPQGLGSAEDPTCAGLSIVELQNMNLNEVDFVTPIYPYGQGTPNREAGIAGDLKLTTPNPQQTLDEVTKRIQKKAGEL